MRVRERERVSESDRVDRNDHFKFCFHCYENRFCGLTDDDVVPVVARKKEK